MSTDLYGIRTLKIEPETKKITIKVFVVYYDVAYESHQPLPNDWSFFFRILWDKAEAERNDAMAIEVSLDDFLNEKWVDQHAYKFIKGITQVSTSNFPVTDYSKYADFYYERNGGWENEEQLVQATYEIELFEQRHLAHLYEGLSWGTTAYETCALNIEADYRHTLPDITKDIVCLKPFEGKEQESGTICETAFSKDNTKLFVLSDAGELVCYDTRNWQELWRNETTEWFATIKQNAYKSLVWLNDKLVFSFTGEQVETSILPGFSTDLPEIDFVLSTADDYHLFLYYNEKLDVYDSNGSLVWSFESPTKDCIWITLLQNEKQVLIREESSGQCTLFDIATGVPQQSFLVEGTITAMNANPDGTLAAFNDLSTNATKVLHMESETIVFDYSTKYHNADYLGPCSWSPNNKWVAITTKGNGTSQNNGYGGFLTVYSIGSK